MFLDTESGSGFATHAHRKGVSMVLEQITSRADVF